MLAEKIYVLVKEIKEINFDLFGLCSDHIR